MIIDKEKVTKAKKDMLYTIEVISSINKNCDLTKLYISTYNIIKNCSCFFAYA